MMKKIVYIIKQIFVDRNILKFIFATILIIYFILWSIAFIMKDIANSEYSRKICQEFVNGPRNVIALIINKMHLGKMEYKTNLQENIVNTQTTPENDALRSIVSEIEKQKEIDRSLLKELNTNTYTFDEPLVVQNPYGLSPLTAIVLYTTKEPELVSIEIKGKSEKSNIKYTFNKQGYATKHIIPIMGLYANSENNVIIKSIDKKGNKKEKELKIQTEKLTNDLSNINYIIYKGNIQNYQEGLNFSYQSINHKGIKLAFDSDGNIRWFLNKDALYPTNYNKGKSVYVTYGNLMYGDNIICEMNYLGKILNMYYYPAGVNHDIYLTQNNTMLLTGSHTETVQDLVTEIDLKTGEEIAQIDYRSLLPRTRKIVFFEEDKPSADWMHMNSIVEYDNDVIISSNYQSAVMRNSKNGKIKWILSDPRDFTTYWQQYLLKPIGEDFEYPYNQHAVEVLPDYDHNPDTVDILLFDNGSSRFGISTSLESTSTKFENKIIDQKIKTRSYSRLVHYRINEKDMTVEQIWQYGKERPELFSYWRGDADLLNNGNILGTFNQMLPVASKTVYVEVDRNKDVIWECYATSNYNNDIYCDYRLERLPIYNDDNDYMDIEKEMNNFVPMEVLKKYGYQN